MLQLAYNFCSWGEIRVRAPRQCIIHPYPFGHSTNIYRVSITCQDCARCLIYDNEQKRHGLCPHEPQRDTQPINKYNTHPQIVPCREQDFCEMNSYNTVYVQVFGLV